MQLQTGTRQQERLCSSTLQNEANFSKQGLSKQGPAQVGYDFWNSDLGTDPTHIKKRKIIQHKFSKSGNSGTSHSFDFFK